MKTAKEKRIKRHIRVRGKISGTAARPRLCVSMTANNMYVQFIDDDAGKTLAAASTLGADFKALNLKRNVEAATALGRLLQPVSAKWFSIEAVTSITAKSRRWPTLHAKPD